MRSNLGVILVVVCAVSCGLIFYGQHHPYPVVHAAPLRPAELDLWVKLYGEADLTQFTTVPKLAKAWHAARPGTIYTNTDVELLYYRKPRLFAAFAISSKLDQSFLTWRLLSCADEHSTVMSQEECWGRMDSAVASLRNSNTVIQPGEHDK